MKTPAAATPTTTAPDSPGAARVTEWHRVPPSAIVKRRLRHLAMRWGPLVALIPLALLVAAVVTSDMRWALVALMSVLILLPMALLPVYFAILLRPDVARGVLTRRLVIRPGQSVTIEYLRDPDDTRRLPPDETIPWHRITRLEHHGAYWLLEYNPS